MYLTSSINTLCTLLLVLSSVIADSQATLGVTKSKAIRFSRHHEERRPTTIHNNAAISVRGGFGPLDPVVVAKVATVLVGVDSSVAVLLPSTTQKRLGLPTSPILDFKYQFIAYNAAAHCLSAACLLFGRGAVSTGTAVASGLLVSTIPVGRAILTGASNELGFPALGLYLAMAINFVFVGGLLFSGDAATELIKVVALFGGLNSLRLIVTNRLWGDSTAGEDRRLVAFFDRFLGWTTLGSSVFWASLAYGVAVPKAIGYGTVPALINSLLQNFVTKEVETYGMSKGPQLASMAIFGACVVLLAF